jgi:phage tail-like protein
MDANQQRFWLIAAREQFRLNGTGAQWNAERRVLRLASRRRLEGLSEDRPAARALSDAPALAIDPFGTWARVSESREQVLVGGVAQPDLPLDLPPLQTGERITDLALAANGILYLALRRPDGAGRVLLVDRRERFEPAAIEQAGFSADRLAVAADGRIWALDRGAGRVALIRGEPLPRLAERAFAPDTFRPSEENLDPPRFEPLPEVAFAPAREIVACAADGRGLVVLLWPADGPSELQRIEHGRALAPVAIENVPAAFDVGWLGGERFAVLVAGENEALAIALPAEGPPASLAPLGDRYPLLAWQPGRFANGLVAPVRYLSTEGGLRPRPLHRLSLPSTATRALVPVEPIDGGAREMVWHRLYLEAVLPPGCGVRVWLAAADTRAALDDLAEDAFHPHDFGSLPSLPGDVARGVWLDQASELAFHDGFLDCPRARDRAGLFTCLIERPGHLVRTLQGRFLAIRLELVGDGQAGPQLAALRAYGPRFSYRDRYLPELYREAADTAARGPASGADFLDRFLFLFESVLTPLEDQVAASWRLTAPDVAPAEALDWLSGWIGLSLEPGLEEHQRRRMIGRATALYRRRGTLAGLAGMLDIVTDDGVRRGDLVIVEQFRLRRTFATILGADLADEDDPLTRGVAVSGNSYLGRTFHLGEDEQREFLALFRPEEIATSAEAAQVAALLDRFANRATVLVHREMAEDRLRLIRRLVERESPAHVETTVLMAGRPLIVALSALLGVDSYLRARPPRPEAELQASRLGGAFLRDAASLDPRVEGDRA